MRRALGFFGALLLLLITCTLSVTVGSKAIPLDDILNAVAHPDTGQVSRVLWEGRIPRTVAAVVVGAALGLSGALIQAVTRNPLGDPGILGVNAGAAAAVTCGVAFFGTTSVSQDVWFALGGAMVVSAAVGLLGAGGGQADPVRLTLAGVALAAVLTGVSAALRLADYETFRRLRGWDAGSLVERGWDVIIPILPFVAAGLVLSVALARPLSTIALGEELAVALGTRLVGTRIATIVAIALLAGAATALAGPIAFVGLMVPHVARWIGGPDHRWILPLSALLAPTLLLLSDVVGRLALWPGEVPAGLVTAFVGGPVLILLVRRTKASAL
jgi:iron complex transport system permease protein